MPSWTQLETEIAKLTPGKKLALNMAAGEILRQRQEGYRLRRPSVYLEETWPEARLTPQQELIVSTWENILTRRIPEKHLIVGGGHGLGKDWLVARLVLGYFEAHPRALCVTTAPSERQVLDLVWRELRRACPERLRPGLMPRAPFLEGPDKTLQGFSTDEAERMQGRHAEFLLGVIDEGPGVPESSWQALEMCATSEHNHLLAIGNPTDPYDAFSQRAKDPHWKFLSLSCLDHPNVTSGKELFPGMVTREWVREQLDRHSFSLPPGSQPMNGEEGWLEFDGLWWRVTNFIMGRILGKIPRAAEDQLIVPELVERAQENWVNGNYDLRGVQTLGGDVARFGNDRTVLYARHGTFLDEPVEKSGQDTTWTAETMAHLAAERDLDSVAVDDTGVGGGVTDQLSHGRLLPKGCGIIPFVAAARAADPERFANCRSELYWEFREFLRNPRAALPPLKELAEDLCAVTYAVDGKVIKLRSKEEIKKKIGRSPDHGDAAALTVAHDLYPKKRAGGTAPLGPMSRNQVEEELQRKKAESAEQARLRPVNVFDVAGFGKRKRT